MSLRGEVLELLNRWEADPWYPFPTGEHKPTEVEIELMGIVREALDRGAITSQVVYAALALGAARGHRVGHEFGRLIGSNDGLLAGLTGVDARTGRQVLDRLRAQTDARRDNHAVDPKVLRDRVIRHPRFGKPRQWTSVTEAAGEKKMSGRQVRRVLDKNFPGLKW